MKMNNLRIFVVVGLLLCGLTAAAGQTEDAAVFVYRGRIDDRVSRPDGLYEIRAAAFDAAAGGQPRGAAQTFEKVEVRGGRFAVALRFDCADVFSGGDLFLQIAVKPVAASGSPFSPEAAFFEMPVRERLSLLPQSACRPTADAEKPPSSAETDVPAPADEPALVGNNLFINNSLKPQAVANFNITGSGTVMGTLSGGAVDSQTEYRIGGRRTLYVADGNVIVGQGTGFSLRGGSANSFFGNSAGEGTSTGSNNSFFGSAAGDANGSGSNNSFFGSSAGLVANGNRNSAFGVSAGRFLLGTDNSFFGADAGVQTNIGSNNSFFGANSGAANTFGSNNTLLGANTVIGSSNLTFATAVGAGATVATSSTIALGRGDGSDTVRIFGGLILGTLGAGGTTPLCRTAAGQIAVCAAAVVARDRRPAVAELARRADEQRERIEEQERRLRAQEAQLEALKKIVCADHPEAEVCENRR